MKPLNVLLLASGSGSLAQAIFDAFGVDHPKINLLGMISDKPCLALERSQNLGIPTFLIPMEKDRNLWNEKIFSQVKSLNPDLVVSVGFMRILDQVFVETFPTINTHPALLPLFPGAHAVADALAAGVKETGSTVHWVDAGVDTGEVISQTKVPIQPGQSESEVHESIKIVERKLIVEVLEKFSDGRLPLK